jgi:hypothetical protein
MGKNLWRISLILLVVVIELLLASQPLNSQSTPQGIACPADLEPLTALMLRDLPGYANRVNQRSQRQQEKLISYMIVAGKPEFEPLPLQNYQHLPFDPDSANQVFFTTLERQYSSNQAFDLQSFYWLFLAQTKSGWRLARLYSQLASLHPGDAPLPPQEASDGVVGQAIQLWLRDCRAGAIRF